jgi:putative transcriptional regulator
MPFSSEDIKDVAIYPNQIVSARTQCGLSQDKFAKILHVSIKTLQQWEEGRRFPLGSTAILLKILYAHPEVLKEAFLHNEQSI